MAPITATTAGLARQTIDDPDLVSLLCRLHSLDIPDAVVAQRGEDVVMAESEADRTTRTLAMIEELVKELEGVPRWRFQEQVSVHSVAGQARAPSQWFHLLVLASGADFNLLRPVLILMFLRT